MSALTLHLDGDFRNRKPAGVAAAVLSLRGAREETRPYTCIRFRGADSWLSKDFFPTTICSPRDWTRQYPSAMHFPLMPEVHTLSGNIQEHRAFRSETFANRRDILVYLPRGYRRSLRQRYPVLYLQDGQNVFDAATAFAHVEWGMDETAQELIRKNLIESLIIVAIANVGDERIHEYAPSRGIIDDQAKRKKRSRGMGRQYGRFLVDEVKPFIDRTYRTRPEPENTGLGGSSLGGLITLAVGLWNSDVFQRLIVMSPSVWWDNQVIVRMVEELPAKLPLRIWLDTGTNEPGWQRARALRDAMIEKGWRLYDDLQYMEVEGADHSEGAWAKRVDPALRFSFPPPPPKVEAARARRRGLLL